MRHLARSGLDVFAHNLETVGRLGSRGTARAGRMCQGARCASVLTQPPLFHMQHVPPSALPPLPLPPTSQQVERLQRRVRDPRAGYFQSLDVLRAAQECGVYTKSSLMLGLGESLCWGCFGSLVPPESQWCWGCFSSLVPAECQRVRGARQFAAHAGPWARQILSRQLVTSCQQVRAACGIACLDDAGSVQCRCRPHSIPLPATPVAGETDDEIIDAMVDMKEAGVDILTFGQYLQPTPHHLPVVEYVTPEKFEHWCAGREGARCRWCGGCMCLCVGAVRNPASQRCAATRAQAGVSWPGGGPAGAVRAAESPMPCHT